MRRRWQKVFKCILFIIFILQLFHLIHQIISYTNHYPTLIGAYCFNENPPLGYNENEDINDELNIQQCSLENIDACQRLHNQTLLFRLHWNGSFTSELNNLIRAFIYAIKTRRRFLIDDQYWNYGSFSSFFNVSKGHFSPWLSLSSYCLERKFVHMINYKSDKTYIPEHLTIARDVNEVFSSLNLIMKPFEKTNQTLTIKRIVANYFWKTLNNDIQNFIDQYANEIQLNDTIYAIHIRRSDKLIAEAREISIEKYIHGIEYFRDMYAQNDSKPRVYVASDDPNAINELRDLRTSWEFVQFSGKYLLSHGHEQRIFNLLPARTKFEATRILLVGIGILSRVKYVVCTFSSNICRFVQILRNREPETVLSLDQQWHPQ